MILLIMIIYSVVLSNVYYTVIVPSLLTMTRHTSFNELGNYVLLDEHTDNSVVIIL